MDSNLLYEVYIIRKDTDPEFILKTNDFDEAKKQWRTLTNQWSDCIENHKPFELEEPVVTSFDPGLISEIKILPLMANQNNTSNPYTKQMMKNGLGNTMRTGNMNTDILDRGYKLD